MGKLLVRVILCITFFYSNLEANENWIQPKVSEDSNRLGHIFRKDIGHFSENSFENRAFIELATSSPENKVASNANGTDIYLKTLPDGTQAWAEVANSMKARFSKLFSLKWPISFLKI